MKSTAKKYTSRYRPLLVLSIVAGADGGTASEIIADCKADKHAAGYCLAVSLKNNLTNRCSQAAEKVAECVREDTGEIAFEILQGIVFEILQGINGYPPGDSPLDITGLPWRVAEREMRFFVDLERAGCLADFVESGGVEVFLGATKENYAADASLLVRRGRS